MKPEPMDDVSPGSKVELHPPGWMQLGIFVEWFEHFIEHTNPVDKPVLLILNGHKTQHGHDTTTQHGSRKVCNSALPVITL